MLWTLVLVCHLSNTQCQTPETAMFFSTRDLCQRFADKFNKDEANRKAGAEERCLETFQGYG
jgi:hypothetical protein